VAPGEPGFRWAAKAAATAAFCLAGALAGTGLYFVNLAYVGPLSATTCSISGPTLVLHAAGECVGVTDGSYLFDPALAKIENKIKTENRRVGSTGDSYVSMAYVMPVPAPGYAGSAEAADEQLEGAYAAQYYANRHNVQGTAPLIQLLIASSGTQAAGYAATDKIIKSDVAADHLVAVAGIGVSLNSTLAEVRDLTEDGIPVIGSTISSDIFDNVADLVRVAPSNTQQINAALAYIKPRTRTAMLIADTNQTDMYDATLTASFTRLFPDKTHLIDATERYDTAGASSGSGPIAEMVANEIAQMPEGICAEHPDVVLFAGRGRELAELIGALSSRPCPHLPVTILTGGDAANMPVTPLVISALRSGVTLDYPGEANPQEWEQPEAGSAYQGIPATVIRQGRQGFSQFSKAFSRLFAMAPDDDGNAMMGYDALLTGITSIRLAGEGATSAAVAQDFNAIQGTRAVSGASGPIALSANYTDPGGQGGSNPVGKVVPVLQLLPNAAIRFLALKS
jgi:hypothetical protein